MNITIVTATPASVADGSGTFVATEAFRDALMVAGHHVNVVRPHLGALPFLAQRFWFNRQLTARDAIAVSPGATADLVVGFDMDGYRVAPRLPVPFIAYVHGVIADEARFERGLTRRALSLQAGAERLAARRAALVLATSAYGRRRIVELYGVAESRCAIVPPAVDVAAWLRAVAMAPRRGAPGLIVLCVAHLYPRKNVATLIAAAPLLRATFPGLQIRIVGTGPEQARLGHLCATLGVGSMTQLLGHVTRAELAAEYAGCDVFCLPSRQEGFGIAFVEAMAAGKPVVALDASSTPELIANGVNGLLVHDDPTALADALTRLLRDPARRARIGEANREAAWRWDAARSVVQFLAAIQPVLTGRAERRTDG